MLKLIVFDWGDVCGTFNKESSNVFFKKIGKNPKKIDEYFHQFKAEFDRNQLSEEEFWKGLAKHIGFSRKWEVLAQNSEENIQINWALLKFIQTLRTRFKTALLSNMDATSIAAIRHKVNLEKYFDKVYFSSELGLGKLERLVLEKMLDDFKVAPEEVLFIDDFPANIECAKEFGINTVLYSSLENLKNQLRKEL